MDEKLYHVQLSKKDICDARYVILPGDPGRVPKIAKYLDDASQIGVNREYTTWLGKLAGENVLVMSTGMGGPSTAIGVEELRQLGVDTFVRIGTSGGMQTEVLAGDVVIANAAIRAEGTSREYVPIEFPAVSDLDVTTALKDAAAELGYRWHVGVVQCKDSYYGQHAPERMPVSYDLLNKWEAWIRAGALASEMETAALFTVCSTLRARAGAVLLCVWNQEREKLGLPNDAEHDTDAAIRTAVLSIKKLIERDR